MTESFDPQEIKEPERANAPTLRDTLQQSLEGTWGAKYVLKQPSYWGHQVKFANWTVAVAPNEPYVVASTRNPSTPDELAKESYRAVQKALDLMSLTGAGHYELGDPWDCRVLWWPDDNGLHLRISTTVHFPKLPYSMSVENTNEPRTNGPLGPPRWHPALRHFRRGQLADEVFSAFQHTYLAFEALLEERFRAPEPREKAKQWLDRGFRNVKDTYSQEAQKKLLSEKGIQAFKDDVYEEVRNRIFHAKSSLGPHLPMDTDAAPQVAVALQTLTWHVLELARPIIGWPQNRRQQMEHELGKNAESRLEPPSITLLAGKKEGGTDDEDSLVGIKILTEKHAKLGSTSEPVFSTTILFDEALSRRLNNVQKLQIQFPKLGPCEDDLGMRFGLDGVTRITVDVTPNSGFSQLIRTHYPERSGA